MRAAAPDRLSEMLTRLKLTGIRDQLDGLLEEAGRRELSLRETLVLLCEREITRKDERRIEMTMKLARFPFVRDLSGFDFAAQPSLDPKQVRELASARWIANGENVLLLGPIESDSYCPSLYAIRMPSHFDWDRETPVAEYDVHPQRA
jgi:DNA replication protein DnaC